MPHRLDIHRCAAAVHACGDGAVVSHRSAAQLWGLLPDGGDVELTVPDGRAAPRRAGVIVHRATDLAPSARTIEHGIPVTTIARTLFDLAGNVPAHQLRRAVERAQRFDGVDARLVRALLSPGGGTGGAAASGGSPPARAPR
ncbi:MAG TPA: hypothetical protein VFT50_10800 [Baekduia sp.]|nr:hypothetical protein [Baekduia sp.]